MKTIGILLIGLLALGCGSVDGTGGNDIPTGPAQPATSGAAGCTHSGAGVDVTVMPTETSSPSAQAILFATQPGDEPSVTDCYNEQTGVFSAAATELTQMQFTVKDGVLQAPVAGSVDVQIASQWFEWISPTSPATACTAEVGAIVNVTDGSGPTCAVRLIIGSGLDPIGMYTISGS